MFDGAHTETVKGLLWNNQRGVFSSELRPPFLFFMDQTLVNNMALSAPAEPLCDFPGDAERLPNWCERNYFKINVEKTKT